MITYRFSAVEKANMPREFRREIMNLENKRNSMKGSVMNYTIEELEMMLKKFNIDRYEFSNKDLIVFTKKEKKEVDAFFVNYENERLTMFAKMLEDFYTKGGRK